MKDLVKFFRHIYLSFVLLKRNIKWLMILLFKGEERAWKVLDFKMYLNPQKSGLCLKEESIHKHLIMDGVREKRSTEIMKRFIERDDGTDDFVHYSQIQMEGYKELKENQLVEFEVVQSPKGPQAQNVKILDSEKVDIEKVDGHEIDGQ